MAEKITPMPVVAAGRVDVSAPNDSGLKSLAQSLNVAVLSAAEIGQVAQANEFQNVKSLIEDATVGPDEAKEIAGNAFFPVNRFAAQNRAGEAKVHAARDAIEADLMNAADSIDARQRLRVHMQKLMEDEPELGVQAGIRQAIADMASPLINDASKRRLENRNIQRRNNESFILRDTFARDPKQFVGALQSILADQNMDATQEPDVHKTAGQTLLNLLIENPASAPMVKQAAREALNSGSVEGAENRAQYAGVLKAVATLEDAANREATTNKARLSLRNQLGLTILDSYRLGIPVKPEIERQYTATFDDPLTAASRLRTLKENGRQAPMGMIDTNAYKAGQKSLDSFMRSSIFMAPTEEDNQVRAAAYEIYDGIMGSIDPEQAAQSGDEYNQAQEAARLAHERARSFVEAQKGDPAADAKLEQSLKEQRKAAFRANDDDELLRIQGELESLKTSKSLQRRRNLMRGYIKEAESLGIPITELRP